ARDRVGAVESARAVGQDLHLLHRGERYVGQVDAAAGIGRRHAAPVEQGERVLAADRAQVGSAYAAAAAADRVGFGDESLHGRHARDEVARVGDAFALELLGGDDLDRQCTVEVGALDGSAGHDDLFELSGTRLVLVLR